MLCEVKDRILDENDRVCKRDVASITDVLLAADGVNSREGENNSAGTPRPLIFADDEGRLTSERHLLANMIDESFGIEGRANAILLSRGAVQILRLGFW